MVGFSKPLSLICESKKGKSRTLNRGIMIANDQLIVFTDDDVELNSNWLEDLWKAFKEYSNYGVYGGPIIVGREVIPCPFLRVLKRCYLEGMVQG